MGEKNGLLQQSGILGQPWWPEELPSDEEYLTTLKRLDQANWKTDYVITHCAPSSVALVINHNHDVDALSDFLEMIDRRLNYSYWFFGHYHDNRDIDGKHLLLWEQIVQLL